PGPPREAASCSIKSSRCCSECGKRKNSSKGKESSRFAANREWLVLFQALATRQACSDRRIRVDLNAIAISRYGFSREELPRFKIADIRPPDGVPFAHGSVRAARPRRTGQRLERRRGTNHRLRTEEILGKHVSIFDPLDGVAIGKPTTEL